MGLSQNFRDSLLSGVVLAACGAAVAGLIAWGALVQQSQAQDRAIEQVQEKSDEHSREIETLKAQMSYVVSSAREAANKADGAQSQAAAANAKLDILIRRRSD